MTKNLKDDFIAKMLDIGSCVFCCKIQNHHKIQFAPLLNKVELQISFQKALYERYSSGTEQDDLKLLNDMLANNPNHDVISFQDLVLYQDKEEYLKDCYSFHQSQRKINQLIEYYKYHYDVPRIYIKAIEPIIEDFHNKYKEIKYNQIKHILGIVEPIDETPKLKNNSSFKALQGISITQESSQIVLNHILQTLGDNDQIKCVNFTDSWFSLTRTSLQQQPTIKQPKPTAVPELMKQVQKYLQNYKAKVSNQKPSKTNLQKILFQDIFIQNTPKITNTRSFQEKIINPKAHSLFHQTPNPLQNFKMQPSQSKKSLLLNPSVSNLMSNQHLLLNHNFRKRVHLQTSSTHRKLNTNNLITETSQSPQRFANKSSKQNKNSFGSQMSQENALDFYKQWQLQQQLSYRSVKQRSLLQIQLPKAIPDSSKRVATEVISTKYKQMKVSQKKLLESIYQGNLYKGGPLKANFILKKIV